jgi:t-SNARE complex subunit (syntaxin)
VISILLFGIIANILIEILRLRRLLKKGEETTVQPLNKLTKALSQSTQLIDEILTEIDARQKLVEKLQEDIETYYKNAEIAKSDVVTISLFLRGEIRKESRRLLWQNIVINFTFFCVGVVITYLIGFSIS